MSNPSLTAGFDQPFKEQIDFFRAKLNLPTDKWDDIWQAAHDRAFVVAGATKADLLNDLRQAVDKAISTGTSLETFRKDFRAIVAKHGWQGWTGEGTPGGFGWRTRVIYETNLRSSYAAGRWAQLTDPAFMKLMPYWEYKHSDSVMYPRPLHLAWNGLTLPNTHPFWKTHFPPNGWGCRCCVIARAKPLDNAIILPPENWQRIDDKTGAPLGIDKGWAYAPGASLRGELKSLVDTKVAALPKPLGDALSADFASLGSGDSLRLKEAVKATVQQIGDEPLETAVIFDRYGRELHRQQGGFDRVELAPETLALLRDNVLVHNHPGSVPASFSDADVKLAVWHGMQEIHVVDRLFHYSLSRPAGVDWGPEYWQKTVGPKMQAAASEITQKLDDALASGQIEIDQWSGLLDHMVWTNLAEQLLLIYQRKPK